MKLFSGPFFTRETIAKKSENLPVMTIPIPLRDGFIAEVEVPVDIKPNEAEKFARVIMSFAQGNETTGAYPRLAGAQT